MFKNLSLKRELDEMYEYHYSDILKLYCDYLRTDRKLDKENKEYAEWSENAFANYVNLEEVILSINDENIRIDKNAFIGCPNIKIIYLNNAETPIKDLRPIHLNDTKIDNYVSFKKLDSYF